MARRSRTRRTDREALARGADPQPVAVSRRGRRLGAGLVLVVLVFVAHWPALRAGFVWDDDVYVTSNPHLRDASGLGAMWTRLGATKMYVPLVFTTFWIEHQLWDTRPFGYHFINIAMHAAGVVLLWLLLLRLGLPGAWLGAALFAVHPVFVESVAWVTELKNTQSTVFGLLALLFYFWFSPPDAREAEPRPARSWGRYALALLAFAAALLSKPTLVGLPLVILVVVWWKRGRMAVADLVAVAPMLALSLVDGLVAMRVERLYGGAEGGHWQLSALERLLVAGRASWFYVGKLIWPLDLVPIYRRWQVSAAPGWQYLFPLAAAAALFGLWALRRRIGRGPLAAAAIFAILLAPLVGIFNVSYHLNSYVADHFQHHAAPALLAALAAGSVGLASRLRRPRFALPGIAAVVIAALLAASSLHARVFLSEEARCRATLAGNPSSWLAMNNLGVALNGRGAYSEAIPWFEKAIAERAPYPEAHNNLGVALVSLGRPQEAIAHYRQALQEWPTYALAHNNLGTALAQTGQPDEARREYEEALRLSPGDPRAKSNLDRLRSAQSAGAHHDRGVELAREGRLDEAVRELLETVRLEPGSAEARTNLGLALLQSGRAREAIPHLEAALRIDSRRASLHTMLGIALAQSGGLDRAIAEFSRALELDPNDADARANLARAQALRGR